MIRIFNSTLKENMGSSTSTSEANVNVYHFVFILSYVSFIECTVYFWMHWESNYILKISTKVIKRRSKGHEKNTSRQGALNFGQWKTFPKAF